MAHVRSTEEFPNEWARLIAEIVARPGWNRQRLADTAKVHRHTIRRWISGESANVAASSVRLIAEAADIDYDIAARAAGGAQAQLRAEDDRAVRIIMDSKASDETKAELIAHVRSRRQESEESLIRDVEFRLGHNPRPQTDG